MSTHKNVIEINGNLYDAKSGLLISGSALQPKKGNYIDGVVKPAKSHYQPVIVKPRADVKPTIELDQTIHSTFVALSKPSKHRSGAPNIKHRSPQRSHTLMRRAVKKPQTHTLATPSDIKKHHHSEITQSRYSRATRITKNPFIHKFNDVDKHQVVKKAAPLAVKAAPEHHLTDHKTKEVHTLAHASHSRNTAPGYQTKSEKLFNDALEKAVVEPKVKSKKHAKKARRVGSRALRWGTASMAGLLLLGLIGYMNMTNINMQLASARAGFAAQMPAYQPSGYHVAGPIGYKPGQIIVSFNSNTDQRNYKLTQEVSQWNSESLQENFLSARNKQFETTQNGGRTIFLYDNGNATWVNGGVWYQIESNALSTDQLVKIASSL